jgi:hypothetical protein
MASSPPDGGGGKDVFVHISPVDLMVLICASGGSADAFRFPKTNHAPTHGAHPSQGEGRAQIVVEPKPELRFEIARGSQGGAADRGASRTGWVID